MEGSLVGGILKHFQLQQEVMEHHHQKVENYTQLQTYQLVSH